MLCAAAWLRADLMIYEKLEMRGRQAITTARGVALTKKKKATRSYFCPLRAIEA